MDTTDFNAFDSLRLCKTDEFRRAKGVAPFSRYGMSQVNKVDRRGFPIQPHFRGHNVQYCYASMNLNLRETPTLST